MADFSTWSHENLAKLAQDQQAEIVRLNNQDCERLRLIHSLCDHIDVMCSIFSKTPNRIGSYKKAKAIK